MNDKLSSQLIAHINVKLALIGSPLVPMAGDAEFAEITAAMAAQSREKDRLLGQHLCPADQRIQTFLYDYLQDVPVPKLPTRTFTLDRAGLARVLSLPVDRSDFSSDIINSYRVKQGVLHNPKSDRRTTAGIFHVTEGGLPIPDDKLGVPKITFAKILALALTPPPELLQLPFTATQPQPAECFVSLLMRPLVCPEVPGFTKKKTMEVRFFVPGNLVSNLDFVEAIFENGGDPLLPENDAALDSEHWTGHTGCVILAPHLIKVTKKSVGLPHFDQATERQRRDGMCWKTEDELYNGGNAFKLTCRDESGVIVTIIADNYFGYCKKEVKTQLSYAANLFGLAEEEHAGGALVFPSYDLGEDVRRRHPFPPAAAFVRRDDENVFRHHGRAAGRLCGGQKFSGNHLCARLGALRFAEPENFLDESAVRRTEPAPLAGKNLRPPVRLQNQDGKAARPRPPVAARRHHRRGHVLPQALHGFRRRQIGDFQAHHRRDSHRPGVRRGFEKGFRPRRRID